MNTAKSACDSAMPTVVQVTSLSANANDALNDLSTKLSTYQLTDEQRATLTGLIAKARIALQVANAAAAGASTACKTIDVLSQFDGFVTTWDKIRAILNLVSMKAALPVDAAVVSHAVADPLVYTLHKAAVK